MPVNINEIKQSEALRREFGVLGGFRIQLDETVAPVVIVADLTTETIAQCAVAFRMAALAGNFNVQQLMNPLGSGRLCLLCSAIVMGATNQGYTFFLHDTAIDVNPTASGFFVDRRLTPAGPMTPRPAGVLFTDQDPVAFTGNKVTKDQSLAAGPGILFDLTGYTLIPGTSVVVTPEVNNSELEVAFRWAERPLLPSD